MHAHTVETLLEVYENPNLQTAKVEINAFHLATDPTLSAAGPGLCEKQKPIQLKDSPKESPLPDCVSPAGCLFCTHHRDKDDFDYVWSLVTYRHLKSLELSSYRPSEAQTHITHPSKSTIDRITAKLNAITELDIEHREWVKEAELRIWEEDFHVRWKAFIILNEKTDES